MKNYYTKAKKNDIEAEFLIGNETIWASQKVVAEIFGTSSQNISKHFIKIIEDEELDENKVSISSKKLFENQNEFINPELINSKNGGRPQKWYILDFKTHQFKQNWSIEQIIKYLINSLCS